MARAFWLTLLLSWTPAQLVQAQSLPPSGQSSTTPTPRILPSTRSTPIVLPDSATAGSDTGLVPVERLLNGQARPGSAHGGIKLTGAEQPATEVHEAGHEAFPASAPGGYHCAGAERHGCDLQHLCQWLCFRSPPCGKACRGCYSEPVCRPGLYEYFLPCASGHPPRQPGCATCGH